eukprot:3933080-Rhodomonas_salina.1
MQLLVALCVGVDLQLVPAEAGRHGLARGGQRRTRAEQGVLSLDARCPGQACGGGGEAAGGDGGCEGTRQDRVARIALCAVRGSRGAGTHAGGEGGGSRACGRKAAQAHRPPPSASRCRSARVLRGSIACGDRRARPHSHLRALQHCAAEARVPGGEEGDYELTLKTPLEATQIGFATSQLESHELPRSEGLGDNDKWGVDGHNCRKWHAGNEDKYGAKWREGDVIGVGWDGVERQIVVSVNGDFALPTASSSSSTLRSHSPLSPYAFAMRSPVLTWARGLPGGCPRHARCLLCSLGGGGVQLRGGGGQGVCVQAALCGLGGLCDARGEG